MEIQHTSDNQINYVLYKTTKLCLFQPFVKFVSLHWSLCSVLSSSSSLWPQLDEVAADVDARRSAGASAGYWSKGLYVVLGISSHTGYKG